MEKKIDFAIGGQALIEGVMMRSPNFVSIAVRKKDGTIVNKIEKKIPLPRRLKVNKIPIIRGILGVAEMMVTGIKALDYATQIYVEEPEDTGGTQDQRAETKEQKAESCRQQNQNIIEKGEKKEENSIFHSILAASGLIISLILSLGFAFVLFKFVPLYATEFLRSKFTALQNHYMLFNLIDGLIRITIFYAYISFLFIFKSFRRVFQYHGAEHMSVHAYEHHKELTPENVKEFPPEHPRCGTSFLMAVLIVSIIVFSLIPRHPDFLTNLLLRTSLIPLIAGIGYEILKWSAKYVSHPLMKIIIAPGILTQYITTQKPGEDQIEVAVSALKNALEHEEKLANHGKETAY